MKLISGLGFDLDDMKLISCLDFDMKLISGLDFDMKLIAGLDLDTKV